MFESILSQSTGTLSISSAIYCMAVAIILGLVMAIVHKITCRSNKNFLITLSVLPLAVQVVIMMVNGNLGTSVAIVGAFSLIRFRSLPGNSREITSVFLAMAIGLAVGMGHILFASIVTGIISVILIVLSKTKFGEGNKNEKNLKIVIPENLDYTNIFDEIFEKYTKKYNLDRVKTTNMGSMYELTYSIETNSTMNEKEFLDELRCKNGNLNISISRPLTNDNEL